MHHDLVKKIEKEIALLLVEKMKNGEMTQERGEKIASAVLEMLPEKSTNQEVMRIVPFIDDVYTEIAPIVYKYLREYEDLYEPEIANEVGTLLKNKEYDKAKKVLQVFYNKDLVQ